MLLRVCVWPSASLLMPRACCVALRCCCLLLCCCCISVVAVSTLLLPCPSCFAVASCLYVLLGGCSLLLEKHTLCKTQSKQKATSRFCQKEVYRDSKRYQVYRYPPLGFDVSSLADFRSTYRKLAENPQVYLWQFFLKTDKFGVLITL